MISAKVLIGSYSLPRTWSDAVGAYAEHRHSLSSAAIGQKAYDFWLGMARVGLRRARSARWALVDWLHLGPVATPLLPTGAHKAVRPGHFPLLGRRRRSPSTCPAFAGGAFS
jgi:hypothetical protein